MAAPQPKILRDDGYLLAVDKPAGLLAHGEEDAPSVLRWAREKALAAGRDPGEVHLVHRLDKDTSGVMLLAWGAEAAGALNQAFRDRLVLKVYLAVTSPVPSLRWLRVEHELRPRRIGGGEFMEIVASGGMLAESEVEVLARGRRMALVRVIPEQGRKHQVRVALAAAGAPICGDFLYGGQLSSKLAKRVMLHARALELKHPQTGEHLILRAPIPADFRTLLTEDGAVVPPDLDRRHRTEPRQTQKVPRPVLSPADARGRAMATVVEPPRGTTAAARRRRTGPNGGRSGPTGG